MRSLFCRCRWRTWGSLLLLLAWPLADAQGQAVRVPLPEVGTHRDTIDLAQARRPYELHPFVLPDSAAIYLNGVRLDSTRYRLDRRHGHLHIEQALNPETDELVAVYRTLPFSLKAVYRRRAVTEREATDSTASARVVREEGEEEGGFNPFEGVDLKRSGSISRGILAGNRRDATVESGLRMQLSGEIVDGVVVEAVLTDENTPIQPEGTTQRLNDFDRVFIQLKHRLGSARLGDFDLALDGGTFANFSRKLQGATVSATVPDPGTPALAGATVEAAGAVSRGTYRTQRIEPIDGVQGPYRLTGKNGERFIIVVAGSETVYLDGERLTRGESNDYVIDYATGELQFTSNQLVTADRRITVEFQYRTNQYARTLLGSEARAGFWQRANGSPRGHVAATLIREADSRAFNEGLGLTSEDSLRIAQSGDGLARRSGAERVEFDPEAPYVQYTRVPCDAASYDCTDIDSVFTAVTEQPAATEPVYRVRFTRVGPGEGHYERVGRTVNGIAYAFRGQGEGSYLPVRLLPAPERKRVLDLRGGFEPVSGMEVFGEWASSVNDENRLSALGDADDRGGAYQAGLRLEPISLDLRGWEGGTLSGTLRRRFTGQRFSAFDRIRPVEFARRWNLGVRDGTATDAAALGRDETIDEVDLSWEITPQSSIRSELGRLERGAAFRGTRRALWIDTAEPGWPALDYRLEYITSRDSLRQPALENGQWLRQLGTLKQPLFDGRLVPRLEVEQERRRQRVRAADSLTDGSLAFVEYRPGLQYRIDDVQVGGEVEFRTEDRWAEGDLRDAATAWTAQSQLNYRPASHFNTEVRLGYRLKEFTDYFRTEQQREDTESLILRSKTSYRPLQRAVQARLFYEGQTERTPTLQEIYVRAGPELGQYVWEDANEDGVIQLDEFIPERTPNEGNYVQTFVPSDSLESTVSVETQLRVQLDPARLWREAEARWKRWLAKVNTRTVVEVLEKSRDPDLFQIYALNLRRFRNPAYTLNGRLRIGQDVTLFRQQPDYGLELSFNQVRGLSERAAGQEERFLNSWQLEGEWRPSPAWSAKLRSAWERNRTLSERFSSRTYNIESVEVEPELAFQPVQALQLRSSLALAQKRDEVAGRQARVWKVPLRVRLTQVRRLQVQARAEMAHVALEADDESALVGRAEYELTDGRGPGTSYRWSLRGQYRINRYLQASLSYDGRAPSEAPVIHTLRAQMSATF